MFRPIPRVVRLALAAGAVAALASPAVSIASRCEAPPGSSAIDQYCEAVPSATGSTSAKDRPKPASGSTGQQAAGVNSDTERSLASRGAEGAAVLALAAEGDGPNGGSDGGGSGAASGGDRSGGGPAGAADSGRPGAPDGTANESEDGSGDALSAMVASFTGGAVTGSGLSWVLLALTLVIAMGAWVSFRRGHTPSDSPDDS